VHGFASSSTATRTQTQTRTRTATRTAAGAPAPGDPGGSRTITSTADDEKRKRKEKEKEKEIKKLKARRERHLQKKRKKAQKVEENRKKAVRRAERRKAIKDEGGFLKFWWKKAFGGVDAKTAAGDETWGMGVRRDGGKGTMSGGVSAVDPSRTGVPGPPDIGARDAAGAGWVKNRGRAVSDERVEREGGEVKIHGAVPTLRYASAGAPGPGDPSTGGTSAVAWNEKGKSWKGEPRQEDLGKEETGGCFGCMCF
jgi:hypothetical protein